MFRLEQVDSTDLIDQYSIDTARHKHPARLVIGEPVLDFSEAPCLASATN